MILRPAIRLAGAACLFTAISAFAQEAAPVGPIQQVTVTWQRNPSKWFRAESQHFMVYSDTSSEDVTLLLNNLERLDYLLRAYTAGYDKTSAAAKAGTPEKLTLYYAARLGDFNRLGLGQPADAVGLYNSCQAGVQGFAVQLERLSPIKDEALAKHELNDSLTYIFEGYARHFLYRNTDLRAPKWLIDGFAQYFSTVRFSDSQLIVGRTPSGAGQYLSFLNDGRRYSLNYKDVLSGNEDDSRNYAGQRGVKLEFDARSWILAHYVLSSPENRRHLGEYLRAYYAGEEPVQAFEKTFGIKAGDLSTAMWRYRLQAAKVVRAEHDALPRAIVNFTSLPETAGDFVLADALLKSCPSKPDGEALLAKLRTEAAQVPQSMLAQMTLSRAQIDWGNPADALPWLEKPGRKDGDNLEAHLLSARAYLRLAQKATGADRQARLDAAARSLARARERDPASPEAALGMLQLDVLARGEPGTDGLDSIFSAWRNARDVAPLNKAVALAFAWRGDGISSGNVLRSMASNERDPATAQWAGEWKRRLDAGVTLADVRAGLVREAFAGGAFREWTIDHDSVMREVRLNAGREDAQAVLPPTFDAKTGQQTPAPFAQPKSQ